VGICKVVFIGGDCLSKYMVKARAPVRIDLAGGWSDCAPFCHEAGGDVVNIAINHYAHAELILDETGKISCNYSCEIPVGSGLGATGALNVALMAIIKGKQGSEELAFQFEQLLGNRGGRQDQWAAKNGGIQHLKFIGDHVESIPLHPPQSFIRWLKKHLILADTGVRHVSGDLHEDVWSRYEDIKIHLMEIRDAARQMSVAVQNDRRDQLVDSFKRTTAAVNELSPKLNEPYRDLDSKTEVLAWKGMGAAAGGYVAIISRDPELTKSTIDWEILDWSIDDDGLVVEE
jgi:D-glycero-alpha-D-manno-heptose-7-phosphate kinase